MSDGSVVSPAGAQRFPGPCRCGDQADWSWDEAIKSADGGGGMGSIHLIGLFYSMFMLTHFITHGVAISY